MFHVRGDLEEGDDRRHGDERDGEVQQTEHDFLKGEQHLVDADLLDERSRIDDGAHGARCGIAHEREQGLAEDQVDGEVWDVEPEHHGEHCGEHDHHEQGIQHRPQHAEHASSIFELEILRNERGEDEQSLLNCVLAALISLTAASLMRRAPARCVLQSSQNRMIPRIGSFLFRARSSPSFMRSMLPLQMSFVRYRISVGLPRDGRGVRMWLIFAWLF